MTFEAFRSVRLENDLPGVLVHLGATLRATLAWNHPDGLAAGNASLEPFARNLGDVSLESTVSECSRSKKLTGTERSGRLPARGESRS